MRITNRLNLPMPIVEAIKNKQYSKGESDITVTTLINPIQQTILKERYEEELEEDAADRIYALQGESIHTILERAGQNLPNFIVEKRFYYSYRGLKLGGQIDIFDIEHGMLQDYKVTSVYSIKDGPKEEYVKQANINSFILRKNGYNVKGLQIVAILRDWSKGQYERELADSKAKGFKCKYPSQQVVILPIPIVDDLDIEMYIHERIEEYRKSSELPDSSLPECSKEERWAKDDVYAVMQDGKKKAYKLFSDEESAKIFIEENSDKELHLVKRHGVSTRCESFCAVKDKCPQYKRMKQGDK